MKGSLSLGKVLGIPIQLHVSWFLIAILITWTLASGYFPQEYPGWQAATYWLVGAVTAALFFAWRGNFASDTATAFHAIFHSVSAFCNAGFSTFTDSLMGFRSDLATNAIIIVLIIFGGFGFTVVRDLLENFRERHLRRSPRILHLRVQTSIVLLVSFSLVGAGAIFFYFIERNTSMAELGFVDRVTISIFQSVTARTAGFNTCDFGTLSAPILMIFIILMFIGAAPGSTGGGIKMFRTLVLFQQAGRELQLLVHPQAVAPVRVGGQVVQNRIVFAVLAFVVLYFATVVALTFALLLSGLDFLSAFSAIIACINNAGPGLGQVGPAGNYQALSDFQTWICALAMLLGRLEIFSVLVLFTPVLWRK